MHELGMCEAVVDAVERRADGRRVTGVRVHVGVLNRVVESAFVMSFAIAATGTIAENADVDIVIDPAQFSCRDCGTTQTSNDVLEVCGACGSVHLVQVSGDEVVLESISVSAPAAN